MCRHETLGRGMRISLTTSIMTEKVTDIFIKKWSWNYGILE